MVSMDKASKKEIVRDLDSHARRMKSFVSEFILNSTTKSTIESVDSHPNLNHTRITYHLPSHISPKS